MTSWCGSRRSGALSGGRSVVCCGMGVVMVHKDLETRIQQLSHELQDFESDLLTAKQQAAFATACQHTTGVIILQFCGAERA